MAGALVCGGSLGAGATLGMLVLAEVLARQGSLWRGPGTGQGPAKGLVGVQLGGTPAVSGLQMKLGGVSGAAGLDGESDPAPRLLGAGSPAGELRWSPDPGVPVLGVGLIAPPSSRGHSFCLQL